MCAQIRRKSGLWYSAEYLTFSISDEVGKYRLTVAGYSGDAGDAMAVQEIPTGISNGMMFSTPDSDNDIHPDKHCANDYNRGWWDMYCSYSVLNRDRWARWRFSTFTAADIDTSRMLIKLS